MLEPGAPEDPRISHGLLRRPEVLLGLTALVAIAWLVYSWGYIEDDGFIHLEYARSLLDGEGFAFDGRHVYADSSPLWVFALTALGGLGIPLAVATKILSLLGLAGLVAATFRLTTRLANRTAAAGLSLLLALNPFVLHWAFAGMEAVAGAALALCLILLSLELRSPDHPKRTLPLFLVAAALAPLLRYELALLSALAILELVVATHRRAGPRAALRLLALAGLASLPTLLWSLYAWRELGSVLPTTGPAKALPRAELLSNAIKIVVTMMLGFAVPLLVGAAGMFARWRGRARAAATASRHPLLLWLWPLLVLAYYAVSGTAMQTRYAIAPGVALTVAVVGLVPVLGARLRVQFTRVLFAGTALSFIAVDAWMLVPCIQNRTEMVARSRAFDDAIRARVPPERPIAVYGIGQAAFELPHRIVDTGGLTIPSVLEHRGTPKEVRDWALAQGAECFIDGDPVPDGYTIVASSDDPTLGWFFDRSRYDQRVRRTISCQNRIR